MAGQDEAECQVGWRTMVSYLVRDWGAGRHWHAGCLARDGEVTTKVVSIRPRRELLDCLISLFELSKKHTAISVSMSFSTRCSQSDSETEHVGIMLSLSSVH